MLPVLYPGLAGGVNVKKSGGKQVESEVWPKRGMSSPKGLLPRRLILSKMSVGGDWNELSLEPDEEDA